MITRRQFLRYSLGTAASASLGDMLPKYASGQNQVSSAGKCKAKVCIIRNLRVWKNGSINQEEVGCMLDMGARKLAGLDNHAKAWKMFFVARDTIALKVNPIARRTGSTKPEVVYALAQAIHRHVGVPYDRFIIFDVCEKDLLGAGYQITGKRGKVQVYASTNYSEMYSQRGVKARISCIITEKCTAMVNIPLLKTHKGAGVSIALKNHYGSIPTHIVRDDEYRYHMDRFKNLVFLNTMSPIRDKTRLIVVDGLIAQYHRGPGGDRRFQWKCGAIVMGTDPVAVDTVCLKIINEKRYKNSLPYIQLPYLDWARQEGLGMNRLEEIEIHEIFL